MSRYFQKLTEICSQFGQARPSVGSAQNSDETALLVHKPVKRLRIKLADPACLAKRKLLGSGAADDGPRAQFIIEMYTPSWKKKTFHPWEEATLTSN